MSSNVDQAGPDAVPLPAEGRQTPEQSPAPDEHVTHTEANTSEVDTAAPEGAGAAADTHPDEEAPASQDENPGAGGVPISPSLSPWPPSGERDPAQGSAVEDVPEESDGLTGQADPSSSPPTSSWVSTLTPTTSQGGRRPAKGGAANSAPIKHTTNGRGDIPSFRRRDDEQSAIFHAPRPRRRPSALDYLVADSPTGIPRAALETKYRRLEMLAHDTPASTKSAPAPSVFHGRSESLPPADPPLQDYGQTFSPHGEPPTPPGVYRQPVQGLPPVFGSPTMTHGTTAMPDGPLQHARPNMLQPSYSSEKTPMSGYELLAAKLVGGLGGPPVTPIYRRFEALNHRLLLYLQADLTDLEAELRSLDRKDTVDRGCGLIPASRRHERWSNTAVSQQRTEILGQIGYKLSQYNKLITSFRRVQDLPGATLDEAQSYRSWLSRSRLIVEDETKFLDLGEDLVCLTRDGDAGDECAPNDGVTPMPRTADEVAFPPAAERKPPVSDTGSFVCDAKSDREPLQEVIRSSVTQLVLSMFVALFVPIATFTVIPTFAGRVVVVALTGTTVATVAGQSVAPLLDVAVSDWVLCGGIYCGAMMLAAAALG
ncbi:hypothetical protein JDV02_003803 [Purpureocillium takamizusanense]|uniref:DUF6594 domain-containing protein n=1 Tax=Purpureocillium takamizusanense TaxID=2060973 RepID=A0A9Q8VA53_9HYPO|nr:uncharacterized protein JDV02_003803 [Purpureocillium takamizusanense]UNI17462.1 hypothetical protein JDV02_003803 [Purpureocillium takamizusanense]